LADVHCVVSGWRALAMSAEVGLTASEVEEFAPAFEHSEMDRAKVLLSDNFYINPLQGFKSRMQRPNRTLLGYSILG
jgi:hypothetical protein